MLVRVLVLVILLLVAVLTVSCGALDTETARDMLDITLGKDVDTEGD